MASTPGLILQVRAATGLAAASGPLLEFLNGHGADPRLVYAADLALEELGGNILRYAFPPGRPAGFYLKAELAPHALVLLFEDEGVPFDPTLAQRPASPTSIETARIGGLGISLVRQAADLMEYSRVDGRNRLRIEIGRNDRREPEEASPCVPQGPGR